MDWMTIAMALVSTLLLCIQGITCLARTRAALYVRRFGLLSLVLALLNLILYLLFSSGALVFSPEFGLVMVQGSWAWFGLILLLVGSATGAGMGLHVSRLEARRPSYPVWWLGIGILVGVLAALQIELLTADERLSPFRIYAFDFWWPLLLIWLCTCLVESALSILRVHQGLFRLWLVTALLTSLALVASPTSQLGSPHAEELWQGYLLIGLPISVSLTAWRVFHACHQGLSRIRRWLSLTFIWAPAGVGVLNAWLWYAGYLDVRALSLMTSSWSLAWLGWPVLAGAMTALQLSRTCREGFLDWLALPKSLPRQSLLLLGLISVAGSLAALVSVDGVEQTLALVCFMMAWILLAEAMANGPIWHIVQLSTEELWSSVRSGIHTTFARVSQWLADMASLSSMPAVIGKTLVVLALLIAVGEIPNLGKTLISPFKVTVLPGASESELSTSQRQELGRAISERVIHSLGSLQRELQKKVTLQLEPEDGEAGGYARFTLVTADAGNSGLGAALAQSSDLEFDKTKIPLSLLVAPIQVPMRWLLGVRLIDGSVQVEPHHYSLLASSTAGDFWKVEWSPSKHSPTLTSPPSEAIARLADELAFKILSTDPTLVQGMTNSGEAFLSFKDGLEHWEHFQRSLSHASVLQAITQFSAAIAQDSSFALAHYWLGLALQKNGQPRSAIEAFRGSLKAHPNFVPPYIALASILTDFERPYVPAAAPPALPLDNEEAQVEEITRRARISEAHDLWQQVIRLPTSAVSTRNRALVYSGLCRQTLRTGRTASRETRQAREGGTSTSAEKWFYLTYYYCKQAEAMYASLTSAWPAKPDIRAGDAASILQSLGAVFAYSRRELFKGELPAWDCWPRELWQGPHSHAALRYFIKASVLRPDDYRIRCFVARTAYVLGDPGPLEQLQAEAAAHVNVAHHYRRLAKACASMERRKVGTSMDGFPTNRAARLAQRCAPRNGGPSSVYYYERALDEYRAAITRDPTQIHALTGYADTFWEWWLNRPQSDGLAGPTPTMAEQAERYARQAFALSRTHADVMTQATTRASRGRVFLAIGQPMKAIEELEPALAAFEMAHGTTTPHPIALEMRWDLAQAYRCTVNDDRRDGGSLHDQHQLLHKKAEDLLTSIRQDEATQGSQAYQREPSLLDVKRGPLVCGWDYFQQKGMESSGLF